MDKNKFIGKQRERRRFRIRKKVRGTGDHPRLHINRSHKNLGCQLIDDSTGKTLVSVSTLDKDIRDQVKYGGNCDAAAAIGKILAERALAQGIKTVKLDRGHSRYHGRVAALADAAREGGLSL